jgi:hypothetical protein
VRTKPAVRPHRPVRTVVRPSIEVARGQRPCRGVLVPGAALAVTAAGLGLGSGPVNGNEIIERALAVSETTGRGTTLAAAAYPMRY